MKRSFLFAMLACALVCAVRAGEEIRVPFNFRWGDSAELVEDTIVRAKAHVADRQTVNGKKVLVVEGHPDPRLKCSKFTFDNDALIDVELQYSDPSWDSEKFSTIFDQTRATWIANT
ncbi:MAG: hypothetical protein ACREKL_08425, partial [Chthoniobacterales bacterium]